MGTAESLLGSAEGVESYSRVRLQGSTGQDISDDPERAAKQALAEERAEIGKVKMSWGDRTGLRRRGNYPIPTDKLRGGLDKRLSYIGPFPDKLFVGNCGWIFRANGQKIELEQVPETVTIRSRIKGEPDEVFRLRDAILSAQTVYRQKAIQIDPLLCAFCAEYPAESPLDFAAHIQVKHPTEFAEYLGKQVDEAEEKAAGKRLGRPPKSKSA